MQRSKATGLVIILYVLFFNSYIYLLSNGMLGQSERRLMYYYITGIMTAFCWWDLKTLTSERFHSDFNTVAFSALITNYILNLLNHHGIDSNPAYNFIIFNGTILVVTLSILLSGWQHGYFKTKYEND